MHAHAGTRASRGNDDAAEYGTAGAREATGLTGRLKECDHTGEIVGEPNKLLSGRRKTVEIDKDEVVTQEETGEPAPIDAVEERVEAEMKVIEGRAKERVAQGLQDSELEQEARRLEQEGERALEEQRRQDKE